MLRRIHLKNRLVISFTRSARIAAATSLFSLSLLCLPELTKAQETDRDSDSNLGLPTRRIGGGTRGGNDLNNGPSRQQCSSLVALGPKYLVFTTEATPTLFFCLPQIEQAKEAKLEFSLYDDNDTLVSQTIITPTEQSGIASLPLPTSEGFQELESDRNYRWHLSLVDGNTEEKRVVEGWVRRIEMKPNLANKLAGASPIERVQLYQQARLWYEALEELAQLKRDNPGDDDVSEQWTELLEGFNLGAIATVPLISDRLSVISRRNYQY